MLHHYWIQRRLVVKTLVPGCEPQRKSVVDLLSNGLPPLPPSRRRRGLLKEQKLQLPPRRAEVEPLLIWGIGGRHALADLRAERFPAPVLLRRDESVLIPARAHRALKGRSPSHGTGCRQPFHEQISNEYMDQVVTERNLAGAARA